MCHNRQLYDLMTMGVKYQLITCSHSGEILDITINHLLTVRSLVTEQSGVSAVQVRLGDANEVRCMRCPFPSRTALLPATTCRPPSTWSGSAMRAARPWTSGCCGRHSATFSRVRVHPCVDRRD